MSRSATVDVLKDELARLDRDRAAVVAAIRVLVGESRSNGKTVASKKGTRKAAKPVTKRGRSRAPNGRGATILTAVRALHAPTPINDFLRQLAPRVGTKERNRFRHALTYQASCDRVLVKDGIVYPPTRQNAPAPEVQ